MPITREDFVQAQREALAQAGVEAASRFVELPGIGGRAHVLEAGHGPPVLLVCGIGTPAAMWAPLMAHLSGSTLYAVDLPGFGLSDARPGFASRLRPNAVAFLRSVLDALGLERSALVGNSLGSLWSFWLALEHPDRVAAMVHVGCPALFLGTSAPLPMRLLSVPVLGKVLSKLQPPSEKQVRELARMVGEDPLPAETAKLLLATERLPDYEPTFLALLRVLVRPRGARREVALDEAALSGVLTPVQLVWGASDPFGAPAVGERATAALPHGELHVVAGGHAPWLRRAGEVGLLARPFLARHAAAA